MTNRIGQRFAELRGAGRKGLIPFVTAGDPHPDWTVALMHALVGAGADLLELGVPFSDPLGDGPAIQRANDVARAAGFEPPDLWPLIRRLRGAGRVQARRGPAQLRP